MPSNSSGEVTLADILSPLMETELIGRADMGPTQVMKEKGAAKRSWHGEGDLGFMVF